MLLHLAVGDKESTVCWKSFFQDMKQRGLVEPLLVILDGNSGLRKAGLEQAQGIVAMYEQEYREAMKCLRTDLEAVLTALRFPESHRKRIRTANLLERLCGEGRRRSKVIPRLLNEKSGLSLMFAVLVDAPASWRGLEVAPAVRQQLDSLRIQTPAKSPNRLAAWPRTLRACLKKIIETHCGRFGVPPLGGFRAAPPKGGTPNRIFKQALSDAFDLTPGRK